MIVILRHVASGHNGKAKLSCSHAGSYSSVSIYLLWLQYCVQNFLSESALDAIEAGRAEFAATLMDMGLLPPSFQAWLHQQTKSAVAPSDSEAHEFDAYCNNARIIKAALCAGKLSTTPLSNHVVYQGTHCLLLALLQIGMHVVGESWPQTYKDMPVMETANSA